MLDYGHAASTAFTWRLLIHIYDNLDIKNNASAFVQQVLVYAKSMQNDDSRHAKSSVLYAIYIFYLKCIFDVLL